MVKRKQIDYRLETENEVRFFNWFSLVDLGRGGKLDLFFFNSLCSSLKIVEETIKLHFVRNSLWVAREIRDEELKSYRSLIALDLL